MLCEQHAAAAEATQRAERLWRSFHDTVAEFYDTGRAIKPPTTNAEIAGVLGVSPQQVSWWRRQAHSRS